MRTNGTVFYCLIFSKMSFTFKTHYTSTIDLDHSSLVVTCYIRALAIGGFYTDKMADFTANSSRNMQRLKFVVVYILESFLILNVFIIVYFIIVNILCLNI